MVLTKFCSSVKCFSINCFLTQYFITFVALGLLVNLTCCLGSLVSILGQLIILSSISWTVTKKFRKIRNKELISSFKKAVVVTGCDTGFGNGLAHRLNENGFTVYATVLDPESAGAKDLITGARFEGKTIVMRMDVTNDEEVNEVYQQIKTDLQKNGEELWAVVNNAGINTFGPIDWGTIDTYKRVFEVNTFGAVRVTRTFLPLIRKSKGRIVNLVSIAGRSTGPNFAIYSMSKHAMISFSDGLRRENKKFGIKVSTIEPMAYKTPMGSDEYVSHQIDRQWNESSDEVKKLYGQEFCEYQKQLFARTKGTQFEPSEKVYEVIDALMDAIRNPEPDISYQVVPNFAAKTFLWVSNMIPIEVNDQLIDKMMPKGVLPAVLKNQE